jgi:small-conductance mechanosensitive channel
LAVFFLDALGIGVLSFAAFIAAFGLGFGQGLASVAQNIVAGIQIVFLQIIAIGDWVLVTGFESGEVFHIGLTHTTIITFPRTRLTVPNSSITNLGERDAMLLLLLLFLLVVVVVVALFDAQLFETGVTNYNRESRMRVVFDLIFRHQENIQLIRQVFFALCAKEDRIL